MDCTMIQWEPFLGSCLKAITGVKTRHIGHLSRFNLRDDNPSTSTNGNVVLVSGPEPYAEQFFNEQVLRFKTSKEEVKILYSNGDYVQQDAENISYLCNLNWKEIDNEIRKARLLIARSGYSTIMDAHILQIHGEWHPTKGQKEQEYLALRHKKAPINNRGFFYEYCFLITSTM